MEGKDLNRLKVVLAKKKRTNKWLAEQISVDRNSIKYICLCYVQIKGCI